MPLLGKVIYLDPGHGGADPGAISGDIRESDINLQICFKLEEMLEKQGAIVYMTRYGDYDLSANNVSRRKKSDLSQRAKIINDSNADLYLSIHLNADLSSTWKGAQVFYNKINPENEVIANKLQEQLKNDLNTQRKYKQTVNEYMYKLINVPGVLVEVGFITNPNERYLLQQNEYQTKLVESITNGVLKYFDEK